MTSGKIVLLTIGVAGVVAAGIVAAPRLMHHNDESTVATAPSNAETPAPATEAPTASKTKSSSLKSTAAKTRAEKMAAENRRENAKTIAPAKVPAVKASEPELQARLKPVLNRGAHMDIAAEGFASGEQFAAVAHAARNTQIPFMVLKHRVVDEHQTLAEAIRASRPDLDVKREVARANDAARFDIAAISG
jgi:hypothetical protein